MEPIRIAPKRRYLARFDPKRVPHLFTDVLIVGAGVGLVCMILGLAWSLLWIAIAWLAYRPLIGIPLLAASVGCIVWLKKRAKSKGPEPVEAAS